MAKNPTKDKYSTNIKSVSTQRTLLDNGNYSNVFEQASVDDVDGFRQYYKQSTPGSFIHYAGSPEFKEQLRVNNSYISDPFLTNFLYNRAGYQATQKKNGGLVYNWIPEYPRTGAKYAQGGWLEKYANGGTIEDQKIPTPTTPSYYPAYPDRTLTTRQMGTPKAPMYAAGATVWPAKNTQAQTSKTWSNATQTPSVNQANYVNSRAISPESAVPYPEVTYPKSARYFTQAPVMQGYNPYNGPMRLHAPDTTKMEQGGRVTSDYKKRAGIPYAISPGVSDAGMYVGPTTQRGITFGDGGDVPPYVTSDPKKFAERNKAFRDSSLAYNLSRRNELIFVEDPFDSRLPKYQEEMNILAKQLNFKPYKYKQGWSREEMAEFSASNPDAEYYLQSDEPYIGLFKKPTQKVIFNPEVTKMLMRGMPEFLQEESVPQKVKVPAHTTIPPQYMDTRGEWSSTPQVPPGYTPEQLLKMGYRAPQKKANGGWLDKYQGGSTVRDMSKPYLNPAMVQAVLANADKPVTNTLGQVVSTPESREKERREKIIAKDPSKYSVEDYKQGIQEPGAENDVLSDPIAMAAALTAGGVGLGAYGLTQVPRMFASNLASEATAGISDYVKGLKVINAAKPTFSTKYLNRLLIARSPKTTKALGQLDPSVAKEMIYSYNPKIKTLDWNEVPDDTYYTTLKDFRVNLKKAKREVDKIKKENPTFSFSNNDYNVFPFFERPENVKKYYDRVKLMEKTYDSQKKFISYLNNKYKDRMDLINQNPLFKNIAEESPQYTDIIYEHLKNPKTTDDEFLNNLIKQANTFTRSLGEDVSPDEFFTLRGRSFTTGNNNTIDVESFPVSGDYGDFRYKIEPTSERMSEIGKYPIEERWSKRFPETFSDANPNITTDEGMYSTLNPEYAQWYWARQKKNKSTGLGAPTIKYNFPEDVPLKYYYFPQHSVFNTSLADQSLKGFNVSKINIPRRDAYEYLPGFTRGYAQGGPIYNWIPNYPRVGVRQYNKKQSGGWLDNL